MNGDILATNCDVSFDNLYNETRNEFQTQLKNSTTSVEIRNESLFKSLIHTFWLIAE